VELLSQRWLAYGWLMDEAMDEALKYGNSSVLPGGRFSLEFCSLCHTVHAPHAVHAVYSQQ